MPNQSTALPSRRPHMDAGALRPMVGQFTDALIALGHTRFTVSAFYDSARHFADWACRSGIAPYELIGERSTLHMLRPIAQASLGDVTC
jgi:hypothetical protein